MLPHKMLTRSALVSPRCFCQLSPVRGTHYDLGVVGGGIVGLATAQEISWRHPHLKVVVLEKEKELATHQTGHNSGVVHAGLYYQPGSLMARLCVEGMARTYEYCEQHGIPYRKVGKLVVATNDLEETRLLALWERAGQNQALSGDLERFRTVLKIL